MAVSDYEPLIQDAAREWNIDPTWIKAIMQQESGGNRFDRSGRPIRSTAGAGGLMQIMPGTAQGLGVEDVDDPQQAIYGGAKLLSQLLDKYGNPVHASMAYNAGPNRVDAYLAGNGALPDETKAFVPAVSAHYQRFAKVDQPMAGPRVGATPKPTTAPPPSDIPSDEDFLKSTGAVSPKSEASGSQPQTESTSVPADDDFLKMTGAAAPKTKTVASETPNDISGQGRDEYGNPVSKLAEIPAPPNPLVSATPNDESGVGRDEYGVPLHPLMAQTEPHSDILARTGEGFVRGAVRGWQGTPNILTPEAQSSPFMQGFVGRQILDPIFTTVGGALGAGNALMSGVTGAIGAGTEAAGVPGLGRDINMGLQVLPMAARHFPSLMEPSPAPPPTPIGPRFMKEIQASTAPAPVPGQTPLDRIGQLIQHDEAFNAPDSPVATREATPTSGSPLSTAPSTPTPESTLPPSAPVTPTGDNQQWVSNLRRDVQDVVQQNAAMGVPNSVGAAATPAELATLTPPQMKAYRRMSELGDILAPASEADNTIHVKGSEPTLAERSADPVVSQAETVIRQRKPDDFEGPNGRLTLNNTARVNAFDDLAGTDPQVQSIRDQQKAAAQEDTSKIMKVAQPADGSPLLAYYDNLLSDPRIRERQDVVAAIKPLRDALFDANGELKTDPMAYWGIHDNIMAKLAKAKDPMNASGAEKFAFDQLLGAKKATDDVMNAATGGEFQKYLDRQSGYFQQINSLEMLQKFRPQLTNSKGMIDANKFHRWLTDIAVRRGRPGVDPAMDITDDTMRGLISIDNDLKRAGNIDLGKARGSPTNLFFEVANGLGLAGAHAIMGASPMGGIGNLMMQQGMHVIAPKVRSYRLNSLVRKHLAPPPEGYNPLQSTLSDEP